MTKGFKIIFSPHALIDVIGKLLFLYGLLGWTYGVLVQLTHPEWLNLSLTHLIPWIRVDTFAIISFVVSGVGFLLWMLTRELVRLSREGTR